MADASSSSSYTTRQERTVSNYRDGRKELLQENRKQQEQQQRRGGAKTTTSSLNSTATEAVAIQQSLQRTQNLLKQELERVSHVATAIDDDGKLLQETMNDHQTMDVKNAKKALNALERAQQFEQRVLRTSMIFFWLSVSYILWSRLLNRMSFLSDVFFFFYEELEMLFYEMIEQLEKILDQMK